LERGHQCGLVLWELRQYGIIFDRSQANQALIIYALEDIESGLGECGIKVGVCSIEQCVDAVLLSIEISR